MRITAEMVKAATMMGARRVLPEKSVADALRQIEESRRLIQQSRTLMNWDALHVLESKKTIAEAKWVLAKIEGHGA
jgi:hypothetical protein